MPDGAEIFQGSEQGIDGRFTLADVILLFYAGYNQDGDDTPINVSTGDIRGHADAFRMAYKRLSGNGVALQHRPTTGDRIASHITVD